MNRYDGWHYILSLTLSALLGGFCKWRYINLFIIIIIITYYTVYLRTVLTYCVVLNAIKSFRDRRHLDIVDKRQQRISTGIYANGDAGPGRLMKVRLRGISIR